MTSKRNALVIGAGGIVGSHLCRRLARDRTWEVTALMRGRGAYCGPIRTIHCDLLNLRAHGDYWTAVRDATHVFYAARTSKSDPVEELQLNAAMLSAVVDSIHVAGERVQHLQVVHGTKWYGSHLGAYKIPAEETDPPGPAMFYHVQQERLIRGRKDAPWTWSTLRPHTVCGVGSGHDHSLIALLAAYATIARFRDEPLCFPGSQACYDSISQATDAELLADAMEWCATQGSCADQAFNCVNSDYFCWRYLWPRLAGMLGLEPGPVRTRRLANEVGELARDWQSARTRFGLADIPPRTFGNWSYLDDALRSERHDISSTIKIRRSGFCKAISTEEMFLKLFTRLRELNLLPS